MERYKRIFENTNVKTLIDEIDEHSEGYQRGIGFFLQDYPVIIDVSDFNNRLHISSIISEKQGEGHATKAMMWILSLADKYGVDIDLIPDAIGTKGLTTKQLTAWYMKLGFKPYKGDSLIYNHR